jgi:3-oxoacyl-[acyl-carrier protein] reductase
VTKPASYDFSRLGPPPGSVVVVCGGCGGIGAAVVKGCLATGLDTIVLDLQATHDANPPPPEVQFIAMDAFAEDQVKGAFMAIAKDHAAVDAVLNLIGAGKPPRSLVDTPTEEFDEVVQRNLRASFMISKYAMPLLKASGAGSLVHTATGMAIRTIPGVGPYAAAKSGVIGLTRALAIENGPTVRVNVIAPGGVTNKVKVTDGDAKGPGGMDINQIMKSMPMQRFADPDDMVAPFLFLAGPSSGFITGQTLHVNGGAITP